MKVKVFLSIIVLLVLMSGYLQSQSVKGTVTVKDLIGREVKVLAMLSE